MMKIILYTFYLILLVCCNNINIDKEKYNPDNISKVTSLKGKVFNWPTDTVYYSTLPFYSPYQSFSNYQIITDADSFNIIFESVKKPFVVFITPEKGLFDNAIKSLLIDNLTDQHYYGHCIKTYTYVITTYIIEPGTETIVNLIKNDRYGKTQIQFLNANKFSFEYYQKSFNLDDKCDKALEKSSKIERAIGHLKRIEQKLLDDLEEEKAFISPFVYDYIKAEIEFGARKEFLKYLRFDHEKYMSTLFVDKIPIEFFEITEFDKENINYATLINEEYNEYLEIYLNFKYSIAKKEYLIYKHFDKEKFDFVYKELPEISKYYYLANNLLHTEKSLDYKKLADRLIADYPNGELNNKLIEKYK